MTAATASVRSAPASITAMPAQHACLIAAHTRMNRYHAWAVAQALRDTKGLREACSSTQRLRHKVQYVRQLITFAILLLKFLRMVPGAHMHGYQHEEGRCACRFQEAWVIAGGASSDHGQHLELTEQNTGRKPETRCNSRCGARTQNEAVIRFDLAERWTILENRCRASVSIADTKAQSHAEAILALLNLTIRPVA